MKSLNLSNWDNTSPVIPIASFSQEDEDARNAEASAATLDLGAVGQLAAGIAHHFNNLLTPIHANSQLLLELSDLSAESRNLIEQNLIASRRAAHLIRQLAGFSEYQLLNIQPLDLNRAVENAANEFASADGRGMEFHRQYGANLPRVLADSASLDHVIRHLLSNAFDAMPEGGRLTLSTERILLTPTLARSRPALFVGLTVSDTGCGIPLEHMAHICEPFFTTKDTADRSGLGLAFVYGIIKQHRGWTEVSSKMGQGTAFKICLPAIPPPPPIILADWTEHSEHATRQLAEFELAAPFQRNGDSLAETEFFTPTNGRMEPFHHWGINE